ncbi:MAG TPA: SIR2 family protein [Ramlibacter sp.]|nr:SIR2 family protein [Ramlibacter sp.]
MLSLCEGPVPPADPQTLAVLLATRSTVPGKLRKRLSAAAQFIENFKHRKTLVQGMDAAFGPRAQPSALHRWLAALPAPLVVHAWYDDVLRDALAARTDWAEVQGLSQAEHLGTWCGWYDAAGAPAAQGAEPRTVLYRPWGGHAPGSNYLVSDSDHVEVLTEIDIQTPIPLQVQHRRASLGFVFLGCRFDDQLARAFARQIMKRSRGPHHAVLPDEPTRMEARFLAEQGITRIALPLEEAAARLVAPGFAG